MKNLSIATTFVLGTLVNAAAITVPVPVEAATRTGNINGYAAEVVESGSMQAPDFITVNGPRGQEKITVTCSPFDWQSYGANSAEWADGIARAWCF